MSDIDYVFICIHCQEPFVISHKEFNCRILRHGVYKANLQPINPHASKDECDAFVKNGLIFGCGRPLQIVDAIADGAAGQYSIIGCDYI
jgi:ethanolamine ammonia-lyase large subunit